MGELRSNDEGAVRPARGRRASPLVLSVATGSLIVAAVVVPAADTDDDAAVAGRQVCGTLRSDSAYDEELRLLGPAHACEHLGSRAAPGSVTASGHHASSLSLVAAAAAVSTDPAVSGSWSATFRPLTRTVGITSVLLHTGKVLLFGAKTAPGSPYTAAYLYDPVTRTGKDVPAPALVFCGSVVQISDGRVLSVGGANPVPKGIKDVYLFDPTSEKWVRQPDTPLGRYYPTSTRLSDGNVLVASGYQADSKTDNPKIELYKPPVGNAPVGSMAVVGPDHPTDFYPKQWVMPDGRMLQLASSRTFRFDPAARTWATLRNKPVATGAAAGGMMVAGPPSGSNTVMTMGGYGNSSRAVQKYNYATNTWTRTRDMPTPRVHMNVVQVPDGTAIGIGGSSSGLSDGPQRAAMSYDPRTDTWTELASQGPQRTYHSTAVLLPDGRIMSAGDDGTTGGGKLIDYYSPPYLFAGPRPTITSSPTQVGFGGAFALGTSGAQVTRAVLVAPGATTHGLDMNTRHVELAVTSTGGGSFTATAPSARVAPPGHYMLFALTAAGVPSVAKWVHVGPLN